MSARGWIFKRLALQGSECFFPAIRDPILVVPMSKGGNLIFKSAQVPK